MSPNTNAIGTGTCNFPINIRTDQKSFLARLAMGEGISTGELIRRLIELGLKVKDGELAAQYKDIARCAQRLIILAAGLIVVWQSVSGSMDVQRVSRGARSRRAKQEEVEV